MKNTITVFSLLFLVSINLFPQDIQLKSANEEEPPVYVLDSSYTYKFNSETDSVFQVKAVYSYNSNGKNTLYQTFIWSEDDYQWHIDRKETKIYNEQEYDTFNIQLTYNADTIALGLKIIYKKDQNGNITALSNFQYLKGDWSKTAENIYYLKNGIADSLIYHFYDPTTGLTSQFFKDYNYYNIENTADSSIRISWDETNSKWVNSTRSIFQYSANSINKTVFNWGLSDTWNVNSKIENYTDVNGYDSIWNNFVWNEDSSDWQDNYIISLNYDQDGKILMGKNKMYIAAQDKWYCNDSTINTYNSQGQIINGIKFQEDQSLGMILTNNHEYFYDSIGNNILDIGYSGIGIDKEIITKTYKYFSLLTANNNPSIINHPATSKLSFYPNPAKDIICVNQKGENIEVSVYSVQGALITQQKVINGAVDISELNNGMYLMKVVDGNQPLGTIRVIKQ